MGMSRLHTDWTAAQALALPDDDNRYEVLDGERVVEVCNDTLTWAPAGSSTPRTIDLLQLFSLSL
jgi:hypothetical protein